MYCEKCGNRQKGKGKYCSKCGDAMIPDRKKKGGCLTSFLKWFLIIAVFFVVLSLVLDDGDAGATTTTTTTTTKVTQATATVPKKTSTATKPTATTKTSTTKESGTNLADYTRESNDPITVALIRRGVPVEPAIESMKLIKQMKMPLWERETDIVMEDADEDDFMFSYPTTDGGVNEVYAFHILKGKVNEIVNENMEKLYTKKKGINKTYMFHKDIMWRELLFYSEDMVKAVLKAPSTAEFRGGWLDPFEGWEVGKKGTLLSVKSTVDSQNSFGAMIRDTFTIRYRYVEKDNKYYPVYFKLGDTVLMNKEKK